jgi:predicted dehydrogenase
VIRIGIIGCGRITHRFIPEAAHVDGVEISAVYNPREGSAERLASRYGLPCATTDIAQMLSKVDAVYIASPHDTHAGYVRQALAAGKHVICEKPMSMNEAEAKSLYETAHEKGLVLLEAVKTAFCPGFISICDVVRSGRIGRVVDIEASFSRLTPTNMREFEDSSFGGSFTELASYTLLPVFRLLGSEPDSVRFDAFTLPNGTDGYTKTTIKYADEATATCKTGLTAKTEGELVIAGTKGYIYARAPWWLTSYFEVRGENPNASEKHECEFAEAGLRYEIAAFRDMTEGTWDGDTATLEAESVARAAVMEAYIKERAADANSTEDCAEVGIWGHRGASFAYPENTLPAFRAAAETPGIKGVEMDIQRTKDGQVVVFHDETLERIMDGHSGRLCDHTLVELKGMKMKGTSDTEAFIPTLDEFLTKMKPYCEKNGLLINIELKTSVIRYEGIEQEAYDIVKAHNMTGYIVWSSFLADSIRIIKSIDPKAKTGMLGGQMGDTIRDGDAVSCDAYHPYDGGFGDICKSEMKKISSAGKAVRAWTGSEPLFVDKDKKPMPTFDRRGLGAWGVTDIFTNVPEEYLK